VGTRWARIREQRAAAVHGHPVPADEAAHHRAGVRRATGTVLRRGRAIDSLRVEATVDGEVAAAAQVMESVVRAG
jgi:hypothetical protein